MPSTRLLRTLLLLTLLLAAATAPCVGGTAPGLRGTVMDAGGLPLVDVEVLLGRAGGAILSTRTDPDGQFHFAGVRPGSYSLLALKSGYQAAFSRVNTLVRDSFDLTLRVLGQPADGDAAAPRVPEDRTWMLRLPARDLLRKLDRSAVPAAGTASEAGPSAGFEAELSQWYAVAWGGEAPEAESADDGQMTQVALAGSAGEAVSWELAGSLERTSLQFVDTPLASQQNESERVEVRFQVEPNDRNQVDFTAYFDQADLSYAVLDPAAPEDGVRDSQAWGYDAGWNARLADDTDLDLRVGYGSARMDRLYGDAVEPDAGDTRWRALGSVSFSPAMNHALRVGMRADLYDFDSPDQRLTLDPGHAPGGLVGTGDRGYALNLFGRDTFTLTGPLALDLGLDYHRLGFEEEVSYFVPQAGVIYELAPGQSLRAAVMMKFTDVAQKGEAGSDRSAAAVDESPRVGYRVAWLGELAQQDLSFAVEAAVRPLTQESALEDSPVFRPAGGGRFASDGSASARELSFRVAKRVKSVSGSTGVRFGDVEGSLLSYLPGQVPVQSLGQTSARFISTMVETSIVPTGTSFQIDFHWVENDSMQIGPDRTSQLTYSSLDMRLQQDLPMVPGRADWRVLLGYQEIVNRSEEGLDLELARLGIAEQSRRVAGGVSIRF